MQSAVRSIVLGVIISSVLPVSALHAEGETKALPTLLIKGEIVSVDTNDPAATLIKVKDRYGFETPIYLAEAKITQGESTLAASALSSGSSVEVEYNFDVNTAKRHAVSVKVAAPAAAAPAAAEAAPAAQAPQASAAVPAAPEAPAAPAASAPTADAPAPAAPAESSAPATP